MLKIPKAVQEIINSTPMFKWAISNKLFNLTKLAGLIKPQIEAQTKKEVKESAITMALSRIQTNNSKTLPKPENFKLTNLSFRTGLSILTYNKSERIQQKIETLHHNPNIKASIISITEGDNEITIIMETETFSEIKKTISTTPLNEQSSLTAIHIKFPKESLNTPGLLFLIIQQLALQYINIVEIASTYSEFIVYVDQKESRLAFDTLIGSFN